jgi:hypothetical protein
MLWKCRVTETQRQTISTEVIVAFIVQKESLVHQNIPLPEAIKTGIRYPKVDSVSVFKDALSGATTATASSITLEATPSSRDRSTVGSNH